MLESHGGHRPPLQTNAAFAEILIREQEKLELNFQRAYKRNSGQKADSGQGTFMKTGVKILFALLVVWQNAQGQGFVNLDFEDATIAPTPVGGLTYPADPTQLFPGWTVGGFGTVVSYNGVILESPAAELMGPNFPNYARYTPLQGSYSVLLGYNGGANGPPILSQTGTIPSNAKSITFLVGDGQINAAVTLNGVNIPLVPISGGRLAGDVSAFADSLVQLAFSTTTGSPVGQALYFDDIQFSSSPVPEPSTLALGALGAMLLGSRRWRNLS